MSTITNHAEGGQVGAAHVDLPSRPEVMAALRAAKERQRQAEIEQVALVATAADAYGWVDTDLDAPAEAPSVLHGERLVQLGAEGTPEVAEFITHEVGPALRMSPDAARRLIADVLNLRHRLPQLWKSVLAGRCEVWAARKVATTTAKLDAQACRWLDSKLERLFAGATAGRLVRAAESLAVQADREAAEEARRQKLAERHVRINVPDRVSPGAGALEIFAWLDAADAIRLDGTLNLLAERLGESSVQSRDQGRARALGLLADPAAALALLAQPTLDGSDSATHCAEPGGPGPAAGVGDAGSGTAGGGMCGCTSRPGTATTLVVHLEQGDLSSGNSGGTWDRFGTQTRTALEELLAHANTKRIRIQPVIDLNQPIGVSTYRPSRTLAASVRLRDGREVFPWSNRRASDSLHGTAADDGLDLDHTIAYPAGPTALSNLGLLSRKTHRAVTHGGFGIEQVRSGVFKWTTPAGQSWWTSPWGTTSDPPPDEPIITLTPDTEQLASRIAAMLSRALAPPDDGTGDQWDRHVVDQALERARSNPVPPAPFNPYPRQERAIADLEPPPF